MWIRVDLDASKVYLSVQKEIKFDGHRPMKRDKTLIWRRADLRNLDLLGVRAAVVGGTGGIGRAVARSLASCGANVLVVGQTFRDANAKGIEFMKADLSLMREARRVGKVLPAESLDLVIFTTGVMAGPKREATSEGIERDMAIR
jgi:NAD(P)-dependent dehydrogenase (short-subunit alcohol dehydrogenase family)